MKYLLYLFALFLFMKTCRTVENMQHRRKALLEVLKQDSVSRLAGDTIIFVNPDLMEITSPLPISSLNICACAWRFRLELHQ